MLIAGNTVVTFHYRVSEPGQGVLEDSHGGQPLAYLHGHHGMLPGLEEALTGQQAGDHVSVTLSPAQAYGERREEALLRVPMSHVVNPGKGKVKYTPGMMVQVNTNNGPQVVRVVKVGLKNLDVDANHPYASKILSFDIDVISVREASEEELAHGHVHGAGGHHH
ncbi:MAG: peptidylprolyl isomerase [Gammaproteobacteria bacterium RBG_16_57_12]|nr:MAG: peptidylprolyl isomerase [Gammaproteobacteria bacterium RBG_16_57_12]